MLYSFAQHINKTIGSIYKYPYWIFCRSYGYCHVRLVEPSDINTTYLFCKMYGIEKNAAVGVFCNLDP